MSEEKKTFGVTVPVAGCLYVEIEAETEEEAKEIALNGYKGGWDRRDRL